MRIDVPLVGATFSTSENREDDEKLRISGSAYYCTSMKALTTVALSDSCDKVKQFIFTVE